MLDRLVNWLAVAAGVLVCALTVLICVDVAGRNSGLYSFGWIADVSEYMLYGVTFFAAPWVLKEGGHIAIDLLLQQVGPHLRERLLRLSSFLATAVCVVLLYYSIKVVWASWSEGTRVYKSFAMAEWPLLMPMPITFLLMILIYARWLIWPQTAPRSSGSTAAF